VKFVWRSCAVAWELRLWHKQAFSSPAAIAGAGKTTLMDCVAGRKTVGRITGGAAV